MLVRAQRLVSGVYAVLRYHPVRIPLLVEAGLTLCWARSLTWFVPFRRYRSRLTSSELQGRPIERQKLREIAWAVNRLSALLPGTLNCLPQALTVQTMLRRRGTEGILRFGVKPTKDGAIRAHAWVEWEEKVLVGQLPDLADYARLPSWPG